MNKIVKIFLLTIMLITTILSFSYSKSDIKLFVENVEISSDCNPMIVDGRVMVPLRAVFQNYGAYITWDSVNSKAVLSYNTTTISLTSNSKIAMVNNSSVQLDVPAQIVNGRFLIPTRFVAQNLGFDIVWEDATRTVKINKKQSDNDTLSSLNKIYDIKSETLSDKTLINIKSDSPILNYKKTEMKDQNKVYIDIQNAVINLTNSSIDIGDSIISKVRYSQYSKDPNIVRVVVDMNKWTNYELKLSESKQELVFSFDKKITIIKNSNYKNDNNISCLNIELDGNKDYKIVRLTNPQRIVLEINNSQFEKGYSNINVNDNIVQGINLSNDNNNTQFVLNVIGQPQYQIIEEPSNIVINLYKEQYQNVSYVNYGEYSQVIINTNGFTDNISSYYDYFNREFITSIPESLVQLGKGTMEINDQMLQRINISEAKEGMVRVGLVDSKTIKQDIYKYSDKIVIELRKDNAPDNQIVVLDAGHGGKDPGTKYKTELYEKDLNLYIVLKLDELLRQKGIKTVMTRDTDVYVDLYKRAQIANDVNATLFVSVHNNWVDNTSYDGTMTLYTEKGDPRNFEFSKIIHSEMLNALGSTDRKIINRPNLVVLRETKMPAVLAEVGFLSNSEDRKKLSDTNYLDKAAKALADGIEKQLKNMK